MRDDIAWKRFDLFANLKRKRVPTVLNLSREGGVAAVLFVRLLDFRTLRHLALHITC